MKNIVVIGGGVAGLVAAATAAREGAPVVLLDIDTVPERVASRLVLQVELDTDGRISSICVVSATRKLTALAGHQTNGTRR